MQKKMKGQQVHDIIHWIIIFIVFLFGEKSILFGYLFLSLILESVSVFLKYISKKTSEKFNCFKFIGGYFTKVLVYIIIVISGNIADVVLKHMDVQFKSIRDSVCIVLIMADIVNLFTNFSQIGFKKEINVIKTIFVTTKVSATEIIKQTMKESNDNENKH